MDPRLLALDDKSFHVSHSSGSTIYVHVADCPNTDGFTRTWLRLMSLIRFEGGNFATCCDAKEQWERWLAYIEGEEIHAPDPSSPLG